MLQRQSRITTYRDLAASGDLSLIAGGAVALLAGQDTLSNYSRTQIVTTPNFFTKQQRVITDTNDSLTYQETKNRGQVYNHTPMMNP